MTVLQKNIEEYIQQLENEYREKGEKIEGDISCFSVRTFKQQRKGQQRKGREIIGASRI